MNILLYFAGVLILVALLFVAKKRLIEIITIALFSMWQISFNIFILKSFEVSFASSYLYVDKLSIIFVSLVSVISVLSLTNSFSYLENQQNTPRQRKIYFAALMIFFALMNIGFIVNNGVLLWVLVETTTLLVAILVYHERNSLSLEATWKYVFVSTIGLSLSLIGIILMNIAIENPEMSTHFFNNIAQNIEISNKILFQIAFILIIIGFSVKMEIFPLHTVCVDANSVAPTPVSAVISTSLANLGFVTIFRFYKIVANTQLANWANNVLYIIGFLSILYAAVYIIRVRHYKRMTAYSSIEHMGLSTIAIATGGIGWFAAIIHLILHSIIKSSLFIELSNVLQTFKTKRIAGVYQYFKVNPIGAITLLLAVVLILGLPPSAMFLTELMIFKALIDKKLLWLAIFVALLMTVIIWIFVKNTYRMLFHKSNQPIENGSFEPVWALSIPQLLVLLAVVIFSVFPPNFLIDFLKNALN